MDQKQVQDPNSLSSNSQTISNDSTQTDDAGKADKSIDYQGPSLKERKEQLGSLIAKEKVDTVRYKEYKEVEVGKEVEDWMERMEKGEDTKLQQPVMDDYGQILLDNSIPKQTKIVLPLNEEEVRKGLHHKAVDSVRWLAEWCLRIIKLAGKKASFAR